MSTPTKDPPEPKASQAARVLARTLPQLMSTDELIDLMRLIEHDIAAPAACERRYRQLGLIMRLIAETGEVPKGPRYDAAHNASTERGEDFPDRETLTRQYSGQDRTGGYDRACQAAVRFLLQGSRSRVPDSFQHASRKPPAGTYTPQASGNDTDNTPAIIGQALIAFRNATGSWPIDPPEYLDWAARRRREARDNGQPPPPLPSAKPFRNAFPIFQDAIGFAQIMRGERDA